MTIEEKMRGFRRYEWTSQMVENARRQGKEHRIHHNLTDNSASICYVMDACQVWSNTPQDHTYWSRIKNNLSR